MTPTGSPSLHRPHGSVLPPIATWRRSAHGFAAVLLAAVVTAIASAQPVTVAPPRPPLPPLPPLPPRLVLPAPAEEPVRLQAVRIETEVSGSQALTAVEMVFHNPNRRVLEGELQFPLLDGQQVVGFALDIDGKLRDAVPVEKARAQQIFEDIARQGVDPGLLAQTAGNNYKLRVYPLPAQGQRRVVVRYSETLSVQGGERLYRLPISYAEQLDSLTLRLVVRDPDATPAAAGALGPLELRRFGTDYRVEIERRQFAGRGSVDLRVPAPTAPEVRLQRRGDHTYFSAEIPVGDREPGVPAGRTAAGAHAGAAAAAPVAVGAPSATPTLRPRPLPKTVGLLWDSSGSAAARDRAREFALLDAYFARMGSGEVRLVRLRDRAEDAQRFTIRSGDWKALRQALEATPADGATRLSGFVPDPGVGEFLLFSDGLDNYGDARFPATRIPVFTVLAAARADPARLRRIAESSGGHFVDLTAVTAAEAQHLLLDDLVRLTDLAGTGVSALLAASPYPAGGRLLVAGRLDGSDGEVRVTLRRNGKDETLRVPVRASDPADGFAASTWARFRIAELEGDYRLHRTEIRQLGEQFGLVTRETSLLVLDRAEDYARYDLAPPPELAAEVVSLRQARVGKDQGDRTSHLEQVVRRFEERRAWWDKDFPKGPRPAPIALEKTSDAQARTGALPPPPAPAPAPAMAPSQRLAAPAPARALAGSNAPEAAPAAAGSGRGSASGTAIRLQPALADAPYATRLRQAAPEEMYAVYLDLRREYAASTAFHLDAADIFVERGRRDLGLRVLSNLAEMDLENRHVLRILGYRLLQAGDAAQAIVVLRQVLELAPDEPQSWRDLGLAYAAAGERQKAVDHLLEVVVRPWHNRFPDIEQTALAELNAIVATSPTPLDTRRLDRRLAVNLPLDLRVVLTWDADNTDIDLWVTDPNGEKAFYSHPLTYQGGRMSRDFTGGYGPEEFALKRAKPGIYKVEANFYGHRQQIVAGATTLQVKLTTGFGRANAREQLVTLRLKGRNEVVFVGEFDVD